MCLLAQLVIFGTEENVVTDKVIDFIILLGKFFIYKCKFRETDPTVEGFLSFLRVRYMDEEYNAKVCFRYDSFVKGWIPYQSLL